MHTINDLPKQYWKDGVLVDYTDEELQQLLIEWNIDAERIEIFETLKYQRDRADEYPSLQEQLDMQYWDKINNTTNWQDAINTVKTKYPKTN
jgi:hypothetical protein